MSYEAIVMRFIPEEINKTALSSNDDKRLTMADGIHTIAADI